ncbi:hypothetical protein ASG52_08365 [Methylobacterium sp. Leaf456]|uniref:hypothetical protein n=1 Tax=Methylobacterium sp. Leaf456 TaxID=1736382 RepID=UPI0006F80DF8|nr:hypothetical protein [Methylobacterium sp. Leaf456]KQT50071.1 hypothetical protein ASG52_08365 [Methylobacterium sp. Leaf456]
MNAKTTRADRRRARALLGRNEPTVEADARFFKRFPARNYRLPLASRPEVELLSVGGPAPALAPGFRWGTIVKQVRPGFRLRAAIQVLEGSDTDAPEDVCRAIYEQAAAPGTLAHTIEQRFEARAREEGL